MTARPSQRTAALAEGRRADSGRRRQRVQQALDGATGKSERVSLSEFARRAGVDRSFVYRHGDLWRSSMPYRHNRPVHQASGQSSAVLPSRPTCSTPSSAPFVLPPGHKSWNTVSPRRLASNYGVTPASVSLTAPTSSSNGVVALEQEVVDLRLQLEERQQELDAARAANRELIARLNAPRAPR